MFVAPPFGPQIDPGSRNVLEGVLATHQLRESVTARLVGQSVGVFAIGAGVGRIQVDPDRGYWPTVRVGYHTGDHTPDLLDGNAREVLACANPHDRGGGQSAPPVEVPRAAVRLGPDLVGASRQTAKTECRSVYVGGTDRIAGLSVE